jgi:hypothetical protein
LKASRKIRDADIKQGNQETIWQYQFFCCRR